jgi:predicted nucleotidyltransferase
MRTIRTKVYRFDELSDSAKEKAVERERNEYYEYGEPLFMFDDYCHEQAKEIGFYDCKFQWSISYSQGDGLSFSGKIDAEDLIKKCMPDIKKSVAKVLADNISIEINGNTGRYAYAAKSDVDIWMDNYSRHDYANIQKLVDKLKACLENIYMNLCKELEKEAYSWIESENEDSAIIDRIQANEYEFTKDGNRF